MQHIGNSPQKLGNVLSSESAIILMDLRIKYEHKNVQWITLCAFENMFQKRLKLIFVLIFSDIGRINDMLKWKYLLWF
jgi:hypothetical protein